MRQWYDFQQKQSFNDDLTTCFRREALNISNSISAASRHVVGALDGNFDIVVDVLGTGFTDISNKLDQVDASIERLALMLDWRFAGVIEQMRVSNLLLHDIAGLLRVPDFQKERQYYIAEGFRHYQRAALDADLYEDALRNWLEAEKREPSDYVVLFGVGMIYLHSTRFDIQDLEKAERYLRKAGKYALVEAHPAAQQSLNILAGNRGKELPTEEAAKSLASKAYFHAAVACYALGKFADSADLAERAFALDARLLEAGFLQSKSLAAIGQVEQSAEILRNLVLKRPFFVLKAAADKDLQTHREVLAMFESIRADTVSQVMNRLQDLGVERDSSNQIARFFTRIDDLIKQNTCFAALRAHQYLTTRQRWKLEISRKDLYDLFKRKNPNLGLTKKDAQKMFEKNYPEDHYMVVEKFARLQQRLKQEVKEFVWAKRQETERLAAENERQGRLDQERLAADRQLIDKLLAQAAAEEAVRDRRWTVADYERLMSYYAQAAKLGSFEASQRLAILKKHIGLN